MRFFLFLFSVSFCAIILLSSFFSTCFRMGGCGCWTLLFLPPPHRAFFFPSFWLWRWFAFSFALTKTTHTAGRIWKLNVTSVLVFWCASRPSGRRVFWLRRWRIWRYRLHARGWDELLFATSSSWLEKHFLAHFHSLWILEIFALLNFQSEHRS